jgi:hypothetical protein
MKTNTRTSHAARALRARAIVAVLAVLIGSACERQLDAGSTRVEIAMGSSLLTVDERRARAGQIRDAAFASGMSQGYLLAGIADAETNMSHCWSELTWACQGPASADCGGGPVVAGAGDGPCEDRQGGLGMFQFDAGTYDDTLAREGDRILSIAGNVEAAVDFVVSMLIRSVYVDGVDDAAQAIEWINGVRVSNERWDPWISTVTHYYNGCTPSASCWSERHAYYLETTRDVHDEMGADFWVGGHELAAQYVQQSFPLAADAFELEAGQELSGYIDMRNVGSASWTPGETLLGTTEPRDGASPLAGPGWLSPHRAATVDQVVAPNEVGRFEFTLRAPAEPGEYSQYFNLVQEGVAWFGDRGGPPDNQLQVRVTVIGPVIDAGRVVPAADGGADVADAGDASEPSEGTDSGDAGMRQRSRDSGCAVAPGAGTSFWLVLLIGLAWRCIRRAGTRATSRAPECASPSSSPSRSA